MRINLLTCAGLFSYAAETTIRFPNHAVIVGPNNAGKSNIFRIMRVLADALYHNARPSAFEMSSTGNGAFVEAGVAFSPRECGLLWRCFRYSATSRGRIRVSKLPALARIEEFFADATIRIGWMRDIRGAGANPEIKICFPRCGFKLSGALDESDLAVSSIDGPDHKATGDAMAFPKFCKIIFEKNDPKTEFKFFEASGKKAVYSPVPFNDRAINGIRPTEEANNAIELKQLLFGKDRIDTLALPRVLGSIMSSKIVHASASNLRHEPFSKAYRYLRQIGFRGDREFEERYDRTVAERIRAMDLEDSRKMDPDGSNMARFLFTLKTSPDYEDRTAFKEIQDRFAGMFENLQVDVALNREPPRPKSGERFSVPSFPQILFEDAADAQNGPGPEARSPGMGAEPENARRASATPGQIGTGALQVLYLLAAAHGIRESVVLLDEPGINLHPEMLQAMMGTVGAGETASQFLIITHSPELLGHELFDRGSDLIYVRKKSGSEVLVLRDDGGAGEWGQERKNLKHQIDVRVFFANLVILVEGRSDQIMLAEVAEHKARKDPKYNLARRNISTVIVDGKDNFEKYMELLGAYDIPYVILADRDDGNAKHEDLFEGMETADFPSDCGSSIGADIVLINGKLEKLMESMDERAYRDAKRGNKISTTIRFCRAVLQENPERMCRVVAFLDYCIERAGARRG